MLHWKKRKKGWEQHECEKIMAASLDRIHSITYLTQLLSWYCVMTFHFRAVECHIPLTFLVYLSWTQQYLMFFEAPALSKPVGKAETWESMTEIMGWIQKQGQMNRQKNRELTGWEENSSVSFLYDILWLWWWTHRLWICLMNTYFLVFFNKLSNTANLSL